MLTWTTLFASLVAQCRLSAQIVFHRKLLLMVLGIAAYYGVLYALAVFRPDEGFSAGQAPYGAGGDPRRGLGDLLGDGSSVRRARPPDAGGAL